jgi:hypothetical protein
VKKRILFKCKGVQHYIYAKNDLADKKFRFGWIERGRDTHICKGFAETRKQGDE